MGKLRNPWRDQFLVVGRLFITSLALFGVLTLSATEVQVVDGECVRLREWPREPLTITLPSPSAQCTLSFEGDEHMPLTQTITSNGSLLLSSASQLLIGQEGEIRCPSLTLQGKRIEHRGKIAVRASEEEGGSVVFSGETILLATGSKIDASGTSSGGTVSIGGGFHGQEETIPNASRLKMEKGAVIDARALLSGDGGQVVLWSDHQTHFLGTILAKGAGACGAGGVVEVSCGKRLCFEGEVHLASESGSSGELLLDPTSIVIQTANPDIDGNGSDLDMTFATQLDNATTTPAGFPNADSIITAGAVNGLLTVGTKMTLAAQTFITVNAPLTVSGSGTVLTLSAPTVNLNSPITLTASGTLGQGTATTVNVGAAGVIQNGVAVCSPLGGGTINLAAATYNQQEVSINLPITLSGQGAGNTIIVSPTTTNVKNAFTYNGTTTYHPVVMVIQHPATIQNLTVNGNMQGSSTSLPNFVGIGYYNTSGVISSVSVTKVQDFNFPRVTQEGTGILAATDMDKDTGLTITVQNSTVDEFQKQGIFVQGPYTATVSGNTVTGPTTPSVAGANGIEFTSLATGTISNNTVTQVNDPLNSSSTGILAYGADSDVTISGNTFNNNDNGCYCINCGDVLTISSNMADSNRYALSVVDTDGTTTLTSNSLSNSTFNGLYIGDTLATQSFSVVDNTFNEPNTAISIEGNGSGLSPQVSMDGNTFESLSSSAGGGLNPAPPFSP